MGYRGDSTEFSLWIRLKNEPTLLRLGGVRAVFTLAIFISSFSSWNKNNYEVPAHMTLYTCSRNATLKIQYLVQIRKKRDIWFILTFITKVQRDNKIKRRIHFKVTFPLQCTFWEAFKKSVLHLLGSKNICPKMVSI